MVAYSAVLPSQLASAIDGSTADTPDIQSHVRAYAVAIPCSIAVVTCVMTYLIWKLYGEFG